MLSVSDLSAYEYCPRKLYMNKVFGLKDMPKDVAIRGKIFHEFYEKINNAEKGVIGRVHTADKDMILKAYSDRYDEILSGILKEKKGWLEKNNISIEDIKELLEKTIRQETAIRAENLFNNITKNKLFGEQLWEVLTPKLRSEQLISSPELGLRGVVDMIKTYDEEVIPIEMKTGKTPDEGVWPGHKLQLASYMYILKYSGKNIKKGIVRYIESDEERIITINPFLKAELLKKIEAVNKTLKNKIPAHIENKNKCKSCRLKDLCYDKIKIRRISDMLKS